MVAAWFFRAIDHLASMNERQKAFCDNYIINGGNATQAYIAAGYSEKGARQAAQKLLTITDIQEYINERLKPVQEKRIMTAEEILLQLSATARREESESVVVVIKQEFVSFDEKGHKIITKTETPQVVQVPIQLKNR